VLVALVLAPLVLSDSLIWILPWSSRCKRRRRILALSEAPVL